MFTLLNIFFHITHVAVIGFTLMGWAFKRTRLLHLVVVFLTLLSWVGLGLFFGWGYCFWTDWHWQIRDRLGKGHPASYVKLLTDSVTGGNWNAAVIDALTALIFTFVVIATLVVNIQDFRKAS